MTQPEAGSEFGGVDMDPQPLPHDLTASETLRAMYQADDTTDVQTGLQAPSPHGSY